jgi:hypothetical protein
MNLSVLKYGHKKNLGKISKYANDFAFITWSSMVDWVKSVALNNLRANNHTKIQLF